MDDPDAYVEAEQEVRFSRYACVVCGQAYQKVAIGNTQGYVAIAPWVRKTCGRYCAIDVS
jgi:hypothetical protein